jgi:hypothetical protein
LPKDFDWVGIAVVMAVLNVREYTTMAQVIGPSPMCFEAAIARQNVNVTGGSVASSPFNRLTRYVRLANDNGGPCRVEFAGFGTTPVADGLSARLAANQTEYFSIPEGAGFSVAVISSA